jgi:serine/threonine protein kinase
VTAETAAPLVANRYRLDEVIGSGAVGRVWRGQDTVLRRAVAVKEVPLPQHLMDDEREALRARVMREAQAAARIHHPGSVQVFDVVDEAERVYLVMELVDELTLADVVATHGPLTPEATAAVGVELLGALEAAHRVGIVHRDVKPRNVMVLPNGGVKLADFGIASLRDDPRLTKTGMVLGTPSYMAPEQALGEEAGPASDLWGTGALLYYAVEGEPPFDRGEPIATLHAVVTGEPRASARAGAPRPGAHGPAGQGPDATTRRSPRPRHGWRRSPPGPPRTTSAPWRWLPQPRGRRRDPTPPR